MNSDGPEISPEVLHAIQLEYVTRNTPLRLLAKNYAVDEGELRHRADVGRWDKERKDWVANRKLPSGVLPPLASTVPVPNDIFRGYQEFALLWYYNQSPQLRDIIESIERKMKADLDPKDVNQLATALSRMMEVFRGVHGIMMPGLKKREHRPEKSGTSALRGTGTKLLDVVDPDALPPEENPSFLESAARAPAEEVDTDFD